MDNIIALEPIYYYYTELGTIVLADVMAYS